MTKKQFIDEVCQKLQCPDARKDEIAKQLSSDFDTAMEQGETWEEIQNRIGTPSGMAAEFNEELKEEFPQYSHKMNGHSKKPLILLGSIVTVLIVCLGIIFFTCIPSDEEQDHYETTAFSTASDSIRELSSKDFDNLINRFDDKMKGFLTEKELTTLYDTYLASAGSVLDFTKQSVSRITQGGQEYVVIQVNAKYETRSYLYTITFDTDWKLAGLYLK